MDSTAVERRNVWMRWRVRIGYPLSIVFWLLATPTRESIMYGSIIAGFGLLIRGAAAGHLVKYQQLATRGPYAYTRNPLYLGSAILAAGFAVAGHSWIAAAMLGIYFTVVYFAVMQNEGADLRVRYGAIFDEYASRVPLFFPRPFGKSKKSAANPAGSSRGFSWAQYQRNREYQALLGTILAMMAVALKLCLRLPDLFRWWHH